MMMVFNWAVVMVVAVSVNGLCFAVMRAGFGVVMVVVLRAVVFVSVQVRRLLVLACWG